MSKTPLESAQDGHCNAGRGPFVIRPGEEKELLRVNGDVSKGRTHVLSVAVYEEDDKPVPPVLAPGASATVGVPLVGILRFGQDGAHPFNAEVDVHHGTNIVVPASMIGFSVRNDATPGPTVIGGTTFTEDQKSRQVAAWIDEGSSKSDLQATRTIQNVETVNAPGGLGTLTRIPPFSVGVMMIVDVNENPSDKLIDFFDDFGNQVGQVAAAQAQNSMFNPIPNQASFVRFQNVNFSDSERHSFVFSLAF